MNFLVLCSAITVTELELPGIEPWSVAIKSKHPTHCIISVAQIQREIPTISMSNSTEHRMFTLHAADLDWIPGIPPEVIPEHSQNKS